MEKLLLCCRNCQTYMPLHHPDAGAWMAGHSDECSAWREYPEVPVGAVLDDQGLPFAGTPVPVIILGWRTQEDHLFRAEEAPDGYTCAVGPLEELAYGCARTKLRLA